MALYRLGDLQPDIAPDAWIAPCAALIGKVRVLSKGSVWFQATLRGDNEWITVGEGSNVQESAVLHTDPGYELTIGKNVTVGHQAMLHGCTIEDDCLIGIQAVVLNGAVIGAGSLIGAGALVPEGRVIPPRSLVLGSPGKVIRELTDEDFARIQRGARVYIERSQQFSAQLVRIDG